MTWFYQVRDGLTHARVFMEGFYCGKLYFATKDFQGIVDSLGANRAVEFKKEEEYQLTVLTLNRNKP